MRGQPSSPRPVITVNGRRPAQAPTPRTSPGVRLPGLAGRIAPGWLLVAVLAMYTLVCAPLLPVAIDDLALAGVFSTDEELSGRITHRMATAPTLSPSHFFAYGALYHELAALPAAVLGWFGPEERTTLLSLRAVSLTGGLATIALTYALGRRLYGPWPGLLAAALVALSPELLTWSTTAHPDTLQLALITGALIGVCAVRDRPGRSRLAMAAALAGLAFATKYAGLLLLPLVLVASAAARLEAGESGRGLLRSLIADAALVCAVFLAVFLVTNPYVVPEWRRFVTQARGEILHARTGHVFADEESPWDWLGIIGGRGLLGPVVGAMALVAGGVRLAGTFRAGSAIRELARRVDGSVLVALWTFGYLAYLLISVRYQAARYALPLLPGAAVLASGLAATLWSRRIGLGAAAVALMLGATAAFLVPRLFEVADQRLARREEVRANPRVLAGVWLRDNAYPGFAVLTDAYVYVPAEFGSRSVTFGLTTAELDRVRPVLVVVNEDVRGRFRDPDAAERYVDGPEAYRERAEAYRRLEAGQLGCYALVEDFGAVKVYADERALRAAAGENGCGAAGRSIGGPGVPVARVRG